MLLSENCTVSFQRHCYKNIKLKKSNILPSDLSCEATAHFPMQTSSRRCARCAPVEKRTLWMCAECKVPLCYNKNRQCFDDYHAQLLIYG